MFVYLLVKEREKKREKGQVQQQEEINQIFQEYKDFPKQKKKDLIITELSKYVFEEEKKEQDEWEGLFLYFEQEKELRTHIREQWERQHFMGELFTFFSVANYSESETLQKRSILVCDIIA